MQKIKVLQVNKLYYPAIGGIEKTLQQLSEGLNNTTDLKVLVCQKKGKGMVENVNGVRVYRTGSYGVISSVPISPSFFLKFREMVKDRDIVHCHLPFPLADLACMLSKYKGKVVVYWHSDIIKQRYWMILYRPIMKWFLNRADVILVGAPGVAKGSKYLSAYLDKCRVVPFAVEEKKLSAGKKFLLEYGYERQNNVTHFLFVGRLVYYKGCSVLLDAFSKIRGDRHLTIVGSGDLESELMAQSVRLNIADKVTFVGDVEEKYMSRYFQEADVFVLPSVLRSEAFALVQLEAMAYGIPIINTNLPSGVPEVSIHGETGLTVEPNNSVSLKKAMEWMMHNPVERIQLGKSARKRVESFYTEEIMIQKVQKIYNELMEVGCEK